MHHILLEYSIDDILFASWIVFPHSFLLAEGYKMLNECLHFKQLGKQERDYGEKQNGNSYNSE